MKKLILILTLIPILAVAKDISDKDIESKFLTVVKDAEVENMLGKTAEFNDCRKINEFDAKDDQAKKEQKLKDANQCFHKKVDTGRNAEALKKLADDLKLQDYGLIKSKNVNDITEYLAKKMRKSLTGINSDDKEYGKQKWEDRKIVDQKVFIDLYTSQLMKNALFEVSRFCFENLRVKANSLEDVFANHWSLSSMETGMKDGKKFAAATPAGVTKLIDNGVPSFFKVSGDVSDKKVVYDDLLNSLTKNSAPIDPEQYRLYFSYCQSALPLLCEQFKATVATNTQTNPNAVVDGKNVKKTADMTPGANACITLERLKSLRTAMKNSEKVAAQFDEMGEDKDKFAIEMIKNPKFYERGNGANEESLDEISSFASSDMLNEAEKNDLADLEKKCGQGQGGKECDNFLVVGDSLEKAIHSVETEMNLKRELEVAQVKELKTKPKELEKYLTDNGHFDLLAKLKNPPPGFDPETEIANIYNARKVAEIENLRAKVGKRQITTDEEKTLDSSNTKNDRIAENIKETKEERARLAQVVMFNNIITSQLELTDKATNKSVGRNVNAWKKEMSGLETSQSYNEDLFEGVQGVAKTNESKIENASVIGGGIIDSILGKAAEN